MKKLIRDFRNSRDLLGSKDIAKFDKVGEALGVEISKILAMESEKLRARNTTTESNKDTGIDDPYGVLDSLRKRNLLSERICLGMMYPGHKTRAIEAYHAAQHVMRQAGQVVKRCLLDGNRAEDTETFQKEKNLIMGFFKALDPFRKIMEYKDRTVPEGGYRSIGRDVDEQITKLQNAIQDIRDSGLVQDLPKSDSYENRGGERLWQESKFLFSNDETERAIAEEMAVTRALHHVFQQKGVKQPDTDDYALAQAILKTPIETIQLSERAGFLETICGINRGLRKAAGEIAKNAVQEKRKDSAREEIKQEDLSPLQLALKKAIEGARNHDNFAEKWPQEYGKPLYFNFNDPWLKSSMKDLGIKYEDVENSRKDLLKSRYARKVISENTGSINEIAYNCSPDTVVQDYEELIRADAKLKYIHTQLGKGLPAPDKPNRINNRDVIRTPGDRLRCYIYALVLLDNPDLNEQGLVAIAEPIVNKLIKEKVRNHDDSDTIRNDEMIEMNSQAGQRALEEVIEAEKMWDLNEIEPSRGLLVYQRKDGYIRCNEAYNEKYDEIRNKMWKRTVADTSQPRYALLLEVGFHFEATRMAFYDPENLSQR